MYFTHFDQWNPCFEIYTTTIKPQCYSTVMNLLLMHDEIYISIQQFHKTASAHEKAVDLKLLRHCRETNEKPEDAAILPKEACIRDVSTSPMRCHPEVLAMSIPRSTPLWLRRDTKQETLRNKAETRRICPSLLLPVWCKWGVEWDVRKHQNCFCHLHSIQIHTGKFPPSDLLVHLVPLLHHVSHAVGIYIYIYMNM